MRPHEGARIGVGRGEGGVARRARSGGARGTGMKLVDFLPARPDRSWAFAAQAGVRHAVCKADPALTGLGPPWEFEALRTLRDRFAAEGFTLLGLEGDPFDMRRIKLGLPGRDEDLEHYRRMLANMGRLGLPLLCYNFMAGTGWYRTRADAPLRGGARGTAFDLREAADPDAASAGIDADGLWENYGRFVSAVLPAAEAAGVRMGLHPDDPPVPVLHGHARILSSAEGIRRALALSDSPSHGLTYCQATFGLLGDGDRSLLRAYADRIVFIHFRDVRGTAERFEETFHDDGPTDMPAMVRLYRDLGIDAPVRVDHVPTMAGEANDAPGYGAVGRLFAVGYLKGLLDTLGVEYS